MISGTFLHRSPRLNLDKLISPPPRSMEPMSSEPTSSGEELSEYVRRPTRTAGDLSEVADASPGITTEDLARDLEAVASRSRTQTESELLEDLLRRVERIEEHLGIRSTDPDDE
jgi:hypothetical protein